MRLRPESVGELRESLLFRSAHPRPAKAEDPPSFAAWETFVATDDNQDL